MSQLFAAAADIADIKYPTDSYDILWIFDNAPSHRKKAEDALNVHQMNVKPGGKQVIPHSTMYVDASGMSHAQDMFSIKGGKKVAKGMKQVLEERGLSTGGMNQEKMREVLGQQPDFVAEQSQVETVLKQRGHMVKFSPKFQFELQPIELYWAHAKRKARTTCNYSIIRLRKCIRPSLDSVPLSTIIKFFRKMRDYMRAYLEGNSAGLEVESAVKKYKSHRRPVLSEQLAPVNA